jgi:hypothetical protein
MSFDNIKFDVNGLKESDLKSAISLILSLNNKDKVSYYSFDKNYGIVFYWHEVQNSKKFENPHNVEQLNAFIKYWLTTEEAKSTKLEYEESDIDFDGSTDLGWRVYTLPEGANNLFYSIFAIKPCYLWYGK